MFPAMFIEAAVQVADLALEEIDPGGEDENNAKHDMKINIHVVPRLCRYGRS